MPDHLSPWFVELARCPAKGGKLSLADPIQVARLNEAIAAGRAETSAGEAVSRPVEGGLIDSPPTRLYPIRDGIISLVAGDAILLD